MSETGQTADLIGTPAQGDANPRSRAWGTPDERPLTSKIFLVSVIVGVIWPLTKLLWWMYRNHDWSLPGRSFTSLEMSLRGQTTLAELWTQLQWTAGYVLSLLPLTLVILHGQTIELLHRTLHPGESNPRLLPERDERNSTRNTTEVEDALRLRSAQPLLIWSILYGLFRNVAWFKGLLSGPTLGAFLRVAMLPLPELYDPKRSWSWFRDWALMCPAIAVALSAVAGAMWAAETGWFSQFNGPLLVAIVLAILLALWPWVWVLGQRAYRKFLGRTDSVPPESTVVLPARHWYRRWSDLCPIIAVALFAVVLVAILDASKLIHFPNWPFWTLLLTAALWPWAWLVLRMVGRMLQVRRLYRRAQVLIEVHHLMKDVASPSGLRNNYILRAQILEARDQRTTLRKLPPIHCESLFELHRANEEGQIQKYFETQELLPPLTLRGWQQFVVHWLIYLPKSQEAKDRLAGQRKLAESQLSAAELPQFLCPVKIKLGFICPTYLISGLLARFDQDWKKIVRSYALDMESLATSDPLKEWPDLRKLQVFIWDCWIQWGPSVPVVRSQRWKSGEIGLQYGYGDENNSVSLTYVPYVAKDAGVAVEQGSVIGSQGIRDTEMPSAGHTAGSEQLSTGNNVQPWVSDWNNWQTTFRQFQQEGAIGGATDADSMPFVIPAEVEGHLRWVAGRSIKGFCEAQQRAEPWLGLEAREIAPKWDSPKMYSAYVWVMIAICDQDTVNPAGDNLVFKFDRDKPERGEPWRGLIPFFQHGNVAEPKVYDKIKEELAAKTIETLMTFLEQDLDSGRRKIEFAYVCAYDDNGDPVPSGEESLPQSSEPLSDYPAKSIRELLEVSLAKYRARESAESSVEEDIKRRIHLKHDAVSSITACDLPVIAERYLKFIERSLNSEELEYLDLRSTEDGKSYVHVLQKIHTGLYQESFPDETERETYDQHYHRIFGEGRNQVPETHCLVAGTQLADAENCAIHGFLILEWYAESKCGLFSYLAVSKGFRDRGIAEQLIQRALVILHASNNDEAPLAIFAETARPGVPAGKAAQSLMHEADRIRVLHKLGGHRIPLKILPTSFHAKL
jgi:hypothetical protein